MATPTPLPRWWMPACRRRFGLSAERPAGMPKPAPRWCLAEWARFEKWSRWLDRGARGPRPKGVWAPAPQWAKTLRRQIVAARPKPKPPPPPAPPPARSRWTDPPWNGPYLFLAWGLHSGDFTPDWIAAKAQTCGLRAVCVQDEPGNDPYQADVKRALHNRGVAYGTWGVPDGDTINRTREYAPDFYMADIEEAPNPGAAWVAAFDTLLPDLPRAIVATGGGIPTVLDAAPWVDHWDCAMQDYIVHGPNMTPAASENLAHWRLFKVNAAGHQHWPVLEINAEGSPGLRDQLELVKPWGRAVGLYCAEYFRDDDWQAVAAL